MEVIFDLTVLYLLEKEKGKYSVRLDILDPTVADCFKAMATQHPVLFEKMKKIKLINDETEINALMISGQQMLRPDSKVYNKQEIKIVGQISGG